MAELVPNRFPATVAYDTNTGLTIKNAEADVYAVTDTAFTTPLDLVDLAGVPIAKLVSSNDGVFPPFVVDDATEHAEVVAKSGSYLTPMVSFLGGSGPAGPAGPAGAGVPNVAASVAGQVIKSTGPDTPPVWAAEAAGSGITGAPLIWPSTFPSSAHSHTATEISNASTVGRNVLTAATQQEARTAIGAGTGNGTSNLALGTTATTAAPGNHRHGATSVDFTPAGGIAATNVQEAIIEAANRPGTPGPAGEGLPDPTVLPDGYTAVVASGTWAAGPPQGGSGGSNGILFYTWNGTAYVDQNGTVPPATKPAGYYVLRVFLTNGDPTAPQPTYPTWVGVTDHWALPEEA